MTLIGEAIMEHFATGIPVLVHQRIGAQPWEEPMSTAHFFREPTEMSDMERSALAKCRGHVLDLGAGAGAHALVLQSKGLHVVAVDWDAHSCQVMRLRGVQQVSHADFWEIDLGPFDTILMLMNGIGMCARLEGLERWFQKCASELRPGACVVADSSQLDMEHDERGIDLQDAYLGEVTFHLQAKIAGRDQTESLPWIFPDIALLETLAEESQLEFSIETNREDGSFLFTLTKP
ncbi:MAG: class I SAM-dependent methyltransferase [Flavobacteriales bacterium]